MHSFHSITMISGNSGKVRILQHGKAPHNGIYDNHFHFTSFTTNTKLLVLQEGLFAGREEIQRGEDTVLAALHRLTELSGCLLPACLIDVEIVRRNSRS